MDATEWVLAVEFQPCPTRLCPGSGAATKVAFGGGLALAVSCPCGALDEVYPLDV